MFVQLGFNFCRGNRPSMFFDFINSLCLTRQTVKPITTVVNTTNRTTSNYKQLNIQNKQLGLSVGATALVAPLHILRERFFARARTNSFYLEASTGALKANSNRPAFHHQLVSHFERNTSHGAEKGQVSPTFLGQCARRLQVWTERVKDIQRGIEGQRKKYQISHMSVQEQQDPVPLNKANPSLSSEFAKILLRGDKRGMKSLVNQGHVVDGGYFAAADLILSQNPGHCLIVTGSYIPVMEATETDGPPGAAVLGNALEMLGFTPIYVTDKYSFDVLKACTYSSGAQVVQFTETGLDASRQFSRGLLEHFQPSLLCSVERLGRGADGKYRNMLGEDVSQWNEPVDTLFDDEGIHSKIPSIGVFDGGNEVGCGSLVNSGVIPSADPERLLSHGSVVDTTVKVTGATSNWGSFGIVAALAFLTGNSKLLPDAQSTWDVTQKSLNAGAVDGVRHGSPSVDGYDKNENISRVEELHQVLKAHGL